ncbi:MAG: NfeD family protein [Ignavibacteriales bacterium]|nr:NfeD family protein [Ignavibacteriales bacterium]
MYETFVSPVFVWAIIGIILFIVELMSLTFVFAFFGVGALIVSLTTWAGITPGINSQLAVFAVSSLLLTFVFRKTAKKRFFGSHDVPPDYKGEKVKVVKAIPVGHEGAISYRGSEWIAFSDSAETIGEGSMVEIVSLDGIRAKVKYIEQAI